MPDDDLHRLLRLAQRNHERAMMDRVARAGLAMLRPGHMTVLRVLDPAGDGMRLSDLARDADVTRQAVQQLVGDLERLGVVESVPDATDGRARLVRYTPFGRAGYERCMAEFDALERETAARLGPRRLQALKAGLRELAR
jgi:DNA-binding MarR family transcriptional regulator